MLSWRVGMAHAVIFEWEGREYDFNEKSADWYWALGIIATAAAVAAILFSNILLALVIGAGAGAIAVRAARHPRIHRFSVVEEGIAIDDTLYLFEDMLHFSVLEYPGTDLPPALSIKTRHILSPHIMVPIVGHDPLQVYVYIAQHVPEGNHEHSILDRFIDFLRL